MNDGMICCVYTIEKAKGFVPGNDFRALPPSSACSISVVDNYKHPGNAVIRLSDTILQEFSLVTCSKNAGA